MRRIAVLLGAFLCTHLAVEAQHDWAAAKATGQATLTLHIITEPPYIEPVRGATGLDAMKGIEADILRGFVRYVQAVHGVTLQVQVVSHPGFGASFPAIDAATENAIALGSVSITEQRKRRYDFTRPYLPDIELLVSSLDVPSMPSGSDRAYARYFEGCTALTGDGSTSYENFQRLKATYLPDLRIDSSYSSMAQALADLPQRPRSLTYVSLPLYLYRIEDMSRVRRRRAFKAVRTGLAFMLPKGSSWTAVVNEYLIQLEATQGLPAILEKHLGPEAVTAFAEIAAEITDSTQSELLLAYQEQAAFQETLVMVEARAQRQRLLLGFGALLFGISVVFIGVLVRQSRYRKRVSEALQQKNTAIAAQREALESANAELLAMQEEVIRTEKLSVLGTLVSNTAHRLNSPLGAIRSSAQLIQRNLLPIADDLLQAAASLPPSVRLSFFDLLQSHSVQRANLSSLPLRERRKVKTELIESLPERLAPEGDQIAESLLAIGLRTYEEVPVELREGHRPAWRAFAQLARMLAALDNIAAGADRTARYIQLLRFYVREAPRLQPEATVIAPFLQEAIGQYSHTLLRGVELESDLDPQATCHLEADWLFELLQQPLVNALQALKGAGRLRVALTQTPTGAEVVFEDNGPGIPQPVMDNLYEPFVAARQDGEGLGLGLYLVHRTLSAVGGSIHVQTSPEKGTTVTLHLP